MNAHPQFIAAAAHVDEAAIAPLPRSRKVHIEGSRPDLRVAMRLIEQSDTPASFGAEANPPLYVYDTSGPYTDPNVRIDIRAGLAGLRRRWGEGSAEPAEARGPGLPLGARAPRRCQARAAALFALAPAAPRQAGRDGEPDALRAPRPRDSGNGIYCRAGESAAP